MAGICQGQIQVLGLDREPACLGFPFALGWGEAGRIIMLDCQNLVCLGGQMPRIVFHS